MTVNFSVILGQEVLLKKTGVKFVLGEVEDPYIVTGLEIALKKMKNKEHSRFTISPLYAFGAVGNTDLGIPPNAVLIYDVLLVSFEKVRDLCVCVCCLYFSSLEQMLAVLFICHSIQRD